ncbi:MAG: tyrosine-type recombinase/integrase [Akkermansia sp.]|nr:tyrosine-type recombinase/integrase [Akkermansia sp.]
MDSSLQAMPSGKNKPKYEEKAISDTRISILNGAVKINGKMYKLNSGVQIWKRHGVDKLIVRDFLANGGTQTRSFPITPDGIRNANAHAKQSEKEVKSYGAEFGALSVTERQAIEFYRQYERECIAQGIAPYGVLNVIWHGIETAKAATSGAPLFPAVMEEYLSYVESRSGESHIRRQRRLGIRMSEFWKNKRINDFKESDVRAYMKTVKGRNGGKPAAWTLAAHLNLVKGLFTYAVKHRIIKSDDNPTSVMDAIDTNTTAEPEVMSCAEVKRLLVWCAQSESWHDLLPSVVLGVLCGIRAIERARMRWSDICPGGREEIYLCRAITKTNNARLIPLSPALSAWLDYFAQHGAPLGSDEFIVKASADTEKSREDRQGAFVRSARKAGFRIPRNAFRHTAASNLSVTQGKSAAAEILGHSERMLIKHYRRAMTAAEAEELLSITPQALGLCC